jgi:NADH:ubiquinone oxidoreductase subunit K
MLTIYGVTLCFLAVFSYNTPNVILFIIGAISVLLDRNIIIRKG